MVPSQLGRSSRPAGTAANPDRVCCACPVRFSGGHRTRPVGPWANGRGQGVPGYVLAAPLATGGVCARWGPIPGPKNTWSTMTRRLYDED